jgi:hypothetical protein
MEFDNNLPQPNPEEVIWVLEMKESN